MNHKDRIIVSAILLTTDKKILLGRTRKGGVYDDVSAYIVPGSVNAYGGCVMERQCLALISDNTPKKPARRRRR